MSALHGPLPDGGLLCVEASAGTGKTHLLSTLAVRYVVEREDVRLADLLVVTYTVAAAAELRDRVRRRLAEVRDHLEGVGDAADDAYLATLAASPDAHGALRRARRALAEFDTASISTIHAFAAAWIADDRGGVGPSEQRRRQAVADVLGAAAFEPGSVLFESAEVRDDRFDRVVGLRLDHPDLVLAPRDEASASAGAFAHRDAVRATVELFQARGRRDGVRTYADLLTDLAAAIEDDDAPVLRALRARYRVGLIDEFQDTDPNQWRLFRRIFLAAPGHTLVVVGDPKQAIYGFRGADVETYLEARRAAADTAAGGLGVDELDVNYRADGAMVEALNGVLGGTRLDEAGRIAYVPVRATPAHDARRLRCADATVAVPLSIRVATGVTAIAARRRAVAEECADEALAALGAVVEGPGGTPRRVTEDDVVVLCESSTHFALLRETFLARGLRTTETRSDDVLTTTAALDVAIALRALRDPGDPGALAAMAHSWFGAHADDEAAIGRTRERLARWGEVLEAHGVVALGRAMTDPASTEGLLRRRFGERALTDVLHLFDVLAAEATPGAGPTALLEALESLQATVRESGGDDVRTRRIDTDAPAIRMMSIHGAKGLEFDVVLCPFVQRTRAEDRGAATIWHDAEAAARLLDAGGGEAWADDGLEAGTPTERVALAESAAGSENRRLLYVALTRARHRTVVWWVRAHGNADPQRDELTALLLDRDEAHVPVQRPRSARDGVACYAAGGDEALAALGEHLHHLVGRGLVEVAPVAAGPGPRAEGEVADVGGLAPVAELGSAQLRRALAERARRCSFSSLVAPEHATETLDAVVGDAGADDEGASGVGTGEGDDEGAEGDWTTGGAAAVATAPGGVVATAVAEDPFGGRRGAAFGSAVHEALEAALRRRGGVTFEAAAVPALDAALRRHGIEPDPGVAAGLLDAASVPIAGGPPLRALDPASVATELGFAMPVADGVDLAAVASAIETAAPDGPFAAWARTLREDHGDRPLAATLVGSIDLVTALGTGRHHVIDYKTNVVPAADGFGREGLLASMRSADYPLQAAIYLVALHRLLRWRVDGYDPERHLGDAHYLYLRGMRPGAAGGVCTWSPGAAAVVALSELLAGAA